MSEQEQILREWLQAIRLEIESRGESKDMETVAYYAKAALAGDVPHWWTEEYKRKINFSA